MKEKLCFIGGGNMASAIINGLLDRGCRRENIIVSDPSANIRKHWETRSIKVEENNLEAIGDCDWVILAVKPQIFSSLTKEMFGKFNNNKKIISIMAGIKVDSIKTNLGLSNAHEIIRAMPNTPALIGSGITALYSDTITNKISNETAANIFKSCGRTIWLVKEQEIDAVTAISGSGPAYFFLFFEAMISAGMELGLSRRIATELTIATSKGSADLVMKTDKPIFELRNQVTSPKGTTEAAINSLVRDGFSKIINRAISSAHHRAIELSNSEKVRNDNLP